MLNYLINNIEILLMFTVILLSILLLSITFLIVIPMKKRMIELSNIMYHIIHKSDEIIDNSYKLRDVYVNMSSSVKELSTNTTRALSDLKKQSSDGQKVYPWPQLAEMIKQTIDEQIAIEKALSSDMRVPNPNSTKYIIDNTKRTYPHVDEEYIAKLALAMLEANNKNTK